MADPTLSVADVRWRPIEEASKGGTLLLLLAYPETDVFKASVLPGKYGGHGWPTSRGREPAHFMPLPEPPSAGK